MHIKCLSINAQGLKQPWKKLYLYKTCLDLQVDILYVQETHMPLQLRNAWQKWTGEYMVVEGRSVKASQGTALLIRLNLQPRDVRVLHADNRLIAVKLLLHGTHFVLVNLYNALPHRLNEFYINKIYQIMSTTQSKENIILMGDFNRQTAQLQKWRTLFEKTYHICDLAIASHSTMVPTHLTATSTTTIDYCWLSSNLIHEAKLAYIPNPLSEHLALCAVLAIHGTKIGKSTKPFYFPHPALPVSVDFVNQLYVATAPLMLMPHITVRDWELCKRSISRFVLQANKTFNLQNKLHAEFLRLMLNQSNDFKFNDPNTIIQLRRRYIELEKIETLKTRFIIGKKIKSAGQDIIPLLKTPLFYTLKKNNTIAAIRVNDEILVQNEMATVISEALQAQFGITGINTSPVLIRQFDVRPDSLETAALLRRYFNLQTLERALASLNKYAPSGPSAITVQLVITFKNIFLPVLTQVFKEWMLTTAGDHLRFGTFTVCFDKRDRRALDDVGSGMLSVPTLRDIRPICIEDTESKLFAKVLYGILLEEFRDNLHPNQFCLAGRSIHDAIHLLHEVHLNSKTRLRDVPICLIVDIEKAFDNVDQGYLVDRIYQTTRNPVLCNGIQNYLACKHSAFKWKNAVFQEYRCYRGVSQGSPMSSLLFAIYIDHLLGLIDGAIPGVFLPSLGHNLRSIAYADDLVVFCADEEEIDLILELLEDHGKECGMRINRNKTSAFYVNNFAPVIGPLGRPIPKFLGIPMPLFSIECRLKTQKMIVEGFSSVCTALVNTRISLKAKVRLINTLCVPKLNFYAPHIKFPKSFLARLDCIVTKFLWGKRKPVVSRQAMRQHYRNGGLSLVDLGLFQRVLRVNAYISWARFLDSHASPDIIPTDRPPPPWLAKTLFGRGHRHWVDFCDDFPATTCDQKVKYREVRDLVYTKLAVAAPIVALAGVPWVADKLLLPPNMWDFTYKLIHMRIPTGVLLHNMFKVNVPVICPMCLNGEETMDHLFVICHDFTQVRAWMAQDLHIDITGYASVFDSICAFVDRPPKLRVLLAILFLIWRARCLKVFNQITVRKLIYIQSELKLLFTKDRHVCGQGEIKQYWPFAFPLPDNWRFLM